MKEFSFISGNRADGSRGMQLHIDRSALPSHMKLGLWLDDDGSAFPRLDRPARARGAGAPAHGQLAELVLLDRARLRTKMGTVEGLLTLEPGTRFDAELPNELGRVALDGGRVVVRDGRRFAELEAARGVVQIDRQPHQLHVFTLRAERPAGAERGARYLVHVAQKNADGVTIGGVSVEFTFD